MRIINLVAGACLCMTSGSQVAATERPNVISDDLNDYVEGYGGHPQATTPNMARLARSGVRFTQAHCRMTLADASC